MDVVANAPEVNRCSVVTRYKRLRGIGNIDRIVEEWAKHVQELCFRIIACVICYQCVNPLNPYLEIIDMFLTSKSLL